jgi:hypothetical protein
MVYEIIQNGILEDWSYGLLRTGAVKYPSNGIVVRVIENYHSLKPYSCLTNIHLIFHPSKTPHSGNRLINYNSLQFQNIILKSGKRLC